jgi:hypothetical protein
LKVRCNHACGLRYVPKRLQVAEARDSEQEIEGATEVTAVNKWDQFTFVQGSRLQTEE